MMQGKADIPGDLGRVVNFAMGEQNISTVRLLTQGEPFPATQGARPLGLIAGVLDAAPNNPVCHACPWKSAGERFCSNVMFI